MKLKDQVAIVTGAGAGNGRAIALGFAEEDWDAHLAIDLKGPFLCVQAVAPTMIEQQWGKIINITSGSAELAIKTTGHYCVARAGLKMLTKVAAVELAPYNINVNAIGPGIVEDTGLLKDIQANPERLAQLTGAIPLRRFANPIRDLAPLAVFLASADADYLTGQSVYLDGGLLLVM